MSQVVYYTVEMVLYTGMPHYNSVISLLFIGQIMMGGPIEEYVWNIKKAYQVYQANDSL